MKNSIKTVWIPLVLIIVTTQALDPLDLPLEDQKIKKQKMRPLQAMHHAMDSMNDEENDLGPKATVQINQNKQATENVNIERKRQQAISLVERGLAYFKSHKIDEVFAAFTHTKQFVQGELYLFAYDTKGNCYANGDDSHLVWKNLYNLTDDFGAPLVQMILQKGNEGGGWVTYRWNSATKVSYVQKIVKNGKTFIIGAGYYPFSKETSVVNLVKGAVALFNRGLKEKDPPSKAFGRMSYPLGPFRYGDLYLYALRFDGTMMAQGDRPGLIGSNALEYKDENGKFVNKEIIAALKRSEGEGVWVDYLSKNALKKAYAEEIVDKNGEHYFIACGFYPSADRQQVIDLVRRGYQFMKGAGLSESVQAFTGRQTDEFRYGDIYLFILDTKGKMIANGKSEDLIGQNLWDLRDQDGRHFIQDLVFKAKEGGGWVNSKVNNAFQSTYVQMIDLGIEDFIIGANFFPIDKHETMNLMVESAIGFLQANNRVEAFASFVKPGGKFVRGDLFIMAFDFRGICMAYGKEYNLIWRNLFNFTDDNGRPFVKMLINAARQSGSGTIRARLNGEEKLIYSKIVIKNDKTYVLSSGYFL